MWYLTAKNLILKIKKRVGGSRDYCRVHTNAPDQEKTTSVPFCFSENEISRLLEVLLGQLDCIGAFNTLNSLAKSRKVRYESENLAP